MKIERATPAQAGIVARLLHDFNHEFETPVPPVVELEQRFVRLLQRDTVVVVLALDPAPVGFALLTLRPTPYSDGPLAQLEELYVVPAVRGSGIGSAMLRCAIRTVQERGCEEMHINVDEPDIDARRFYERHGFSNYELGQEYRMLCYVRELET